MDQIRPNGHFYNHGSSCPHDTCGTRRVWVNPALIFASILVLIAVACSGGTEETAFPSAAADAPVIAATDAETQTESSASTRPTFKITGITNWLNGEATTIADEAAQDNVVLIDFWTYTCINCVRTIPRLQSWHDKYDDRGLTIIGVHSPEFEFEQDTENLRTAIDQLGVDWLVAQDNDMATWRAFDNHVWPAKYLFSAGGLQVYQHLGEGDYSTTETRIREALVAAGHDLTDIPFDKPSDDVRDPFAFPETGEIYAGYEASYQPQGLYNGHPEFYTGPNQVLEYTDPGDGFRLDGSYYLQGSWENRAESIVHARETENLEDYIAIDFSARSVNVVINPSSAGTPFEPFEVIIEIDERPLKPEEAGGDIVFNERGQSVILVDESRLYALLELSKSTQANLKMRSNSNNFAVFAWTFGSYIGGA